MDILNSLILPNFDSVWTSTGLTKCGSARVDRKLEFAMTGADDLMTSDTIWPLALRAFQPLWCLKIKFCWGLHESKTIRNFLQLQTVAEKIYFKAYPASGEKLNITVYAYVNFDGRFHPEILYPGQIKAHGWMGLPNSCSDQLKNLKSDIRLERNSISCSRGISNSSIFLIYRLLARNMSWLESKFLAQFSTD